MGKITDFFRSIQNGIESDNIEKSKPQITPALVNPDGVARYPTMEDLANPPEQNRGFDFYKDTQTQMGYVGGTTRPGNPLPYLSTDTGAKVPLYPIPLVRLFEMTNHVPDVKTVINVIQREMFKNDFDVKPKFNYKCKNCGKEFDSKPVKKVSTLEEAEKKEPVLKCDSCKREGEDNFRTPNPYERQILVDLFHKTVNVNNQNIEDIIRQYEYDLDVADNAYCLILKNYYLRKVNKGKVKLEVDEEKTEISEFLRIHPAQVAIIADADARPGYDDNRNKVYVCPDFRHRNKTLVDPVCPECGARALEALLETNTIFSAGIVQPKKVIYAKDEVIWTSGKYTPDMLYGFPVLISVWKKAMALFHMDEYVLKYFDKQRPPRSLLIINSRNAEGVKQMWEKQRQGAREDPLMPRPLLVENDKGGAKNAVEHIDLVGKLTDLQFTDVRDEFRQAIFAAYGFPPFLFGKVDKGGFGGANMQMTETNRTIQASQVFLKKTFIDHIVRAIGVKDWEIIINRGEETDDLRDEQLAGQKLDNAVKAHVDLGFDVWFDGDGNPQTSQVPNPEFLEAQKLNSMGNRSGDKSKNTQPNEEEDTKFQGEIHSKRPSDIGGSAQGDPNNAASLSNKSLDDDIRFTLLGGIEKGWTQTHIAKEINKLLPGMSHNEAYTFVKESLRNGIYKNTQE